MQVTARHTAATKWQAHLVLPTGQFLQELSHNEGIGKAVHPVPLFEVFAAHNGELHVTILVDLKLELAQLLDAPQLALVHLQHCVRMETRRIDLCARMGPGPACAYV